MRGGQGMGVLVLVPTALTPKGQGTLLAPSPKPPSLWICTLELGLGLLPQVLSKSGGYQAAARLSSAWCCRIWVWGSWAADDTQGQLTLCMQQCHGIPLPPPPHR